MDELFLKFCLWLGLTMMAGQWLIAINIKTHIIPIKHWILYFLFSMLILIRVINMPVVS